MTKSYISTLDVARAANIHPNTVRIYETWGLIPTAQRSEKGYRHFTPFHIDQIKLARLAMADPWPGREIRHSAICIVKKSAGGDLVNALSDSQKHLMLVHKEQKYAYDAANAVEDWVSGRLNLIMDEGEILSIGQTAARLDISVDMLRNWEHNGLIRPPRRSNAYRYYRQVEISRLSIIRMLCKAGYSLLAVLRMLNSLENDQGVDIPHILDTPRPEDDLGHATDHWLTTLMEAEKRANMIITLLEKMQELYPNQGESMSISSGTAPIV